MHIPDGFLDAKTCISTGVISAGSIGYTIKNLKGKVKEEEIPKMGVISAFIFAAQMINFPIWAGTSGHLIGATLATLLLGPLKAIIAMCSIVFVQGVFFQDGGIMALGANMLNIAIVPVTIAYLFNKVFKNIIKSEKVMIFLMAWFSVVITSILAGIELGISGTYDYITVIGAMVVWHSIIGIGEGLITYFSYIYIQKIGMKKVNGFDNKGGNIHENK